MTNRARPFALSIAACSLIALGACAGNQLLPQRHTQLSNNISSAYADRAVASVGELPLQRAEGALADAEKAWTDGDEAIADHHMNRAQIYLDIAQTRGNAAMARQEIETLEQRMTEARLSAREQQARAAQDRAATAEARLADMRQQLAEYKTQMTSLGTTLVLQDVIFEVGKAELKPGAADRLAALVNYLSANADVQVQIAGHTDSQGSDAFNQDLSQRRAEAVAAHMQSRGIDRARIETVGYGESKPIASNVNAAGRQENRRVEITLIGQGGNQTSAMSSIGKS